MVEISEKRFFYIIITIMIIDLIIDGIDDFGTRLYFIHFIRNVAIICLALVLSIRLKRVKKYN